MKKPHLTVESIQSTTWKRLARKSRYYPPRFARLVKIRPRTLQRFFKRHFSYTPNQWLNRMRLDEAKRLAERGLGTREIAKRLYFKSVPTLCREFKIQFGETLSAVKKAKKKRS